jgi:MoxR-like ATPase
LDKPFIVLATQNPIEQSGTYKLPEAELDRFMLKVNVTYPTYEQEKEMYKNILTNENVKIKKVLKKENIFWVQDLVSEVFVSDSIYEYVMNIIDATRNLEKYGVENLNKYIVY